MLPFLKNKQDASVSAPVDVVHRESDHEDESDYDGLESCVADLFSALKSNDLKAGAEALRAAHEICDLYPHAEGEHTNEE